MITKNMIEEVKKRLVDVYQPLTIYIFGSYAWGIPSEESDLDVLIVVPSSDEKTYIRPAAGHQALAGLNISKDIIVYTQKEFETLSQRATSLCARIKQEGKVLYARA